MADDTAKKTTKKAKETKTEAKKEEKKVVKKATKSKKTKEVIKEKASQTEVKEAKKEASTPKENTKAKTAKVTSMEDLLAKASNVLVVPKKGETVNGTITHKDSKSLRLDIGAKTEGLVVDKEYDFAIDYIEDLKVGDKTEAVVVSTDNDRGLILMSLKGSANEAKWDFFKNALDNEEILDAKGIEVNKGGLIVLVNGIRGFVPASQFGRAYVGKLKELKGKTF